jgi:hypothetical protein
MRLSRFSSMCLLGGLLLILISCTPLSMAIAKPVEIGDWITIPTNKPHPRLFFNRDEIPAIREFAKNTQEAKPFVDRIIQIADRWVGQDIVLPDEGALVRDAAYGASQKLHDDLGSAIDEIGLAYILTGKEKYAAQVKSVLLQYADKYTSYSFSGSKYGAEKPSSSNQGRLVPQARAEAHLAVHYALAYDIIADTGLLTDKEKARIEDNFLREVYRTLQLSKEWTEGGKPREWPNDSNHGSIRNAGIAALGYTLGDEDIVNDAITGPLGLLMQAATMYYDDGYLNEEAPSYHTYALTSHMTVVEAAFNNGLDLYAQLPRLKNMFLLPMDIVLPNGYMPPVGDASYKPLPMGLYGIAQLRYQDDIFALVHTGKNIYDDYLAMYCLFERYIPPSLQGPVSPLMSKNFPEAGLGILRNGGANDVYALLSYGPHGGNHGHRDKLSLLVYGAGALLANDEKPAYRTIWRNNWFRQTFSHNTVTVDQQWQRSCRGQSEGLLSVPGLQLVSASADSAYAGVRHARNVIMVADRYLLVVDVLESQQPHTYDWNYHAPGTLTPDFPLQPHYAGNLPPYIAGGGQLAILHDVRESRPLNTWNAVWRNDNAMLRITMPEQSEKMTVYTGNGPRYTPGTFTLTSEDMLWDMPMVFARRTAKSTVFSAVLEVLRDGQKPASSIELVSESFPHTVKIQWDDGYEDVVTLHHPRGIQTPAQNLESDTNFDGSHYFALPDKAARVSFVRRHHGTLVEAGMLGGQKLAVDDIDIDIAPQSNILLQQEENVWRLHHTGQAGTQITFGEAFLNARIRKNNATRDMQTKRFRDTQTIALEAKAEYNIRIVK